MIYVLFYSVFDCYVMIQIAFCSVFDLHVVFHVLFCSVFCFLLSNCLSYSVPLSVFVAVLCCVALCSRSFACIRSSRFMARFQVSRLPLRALSCSTCPSRLSAAHTVASGLSKDSVSLLIRRQMRGADRECRMSGGKRRLAISALAATVATGRGAGNEVTVTIVRVGAPPRSGA
jgi:hypothetical protein